MKNMKMPKALMSMLLAILMLMSFAFVPKGFAALFWKNPYVDYAPSGVPDFDQKQDAWVNPVTGKWSYCGPVAVANSLWWMDSRFETSNTPPPIVNDTYPLVRSYTLGLDDHDPLNVPNLVQHLAYLMDTDGQRTHVAHAGTNVIDMQVGIAQYLSWIGVNQRGDLNGDGITDQTDLNIMQAAMGSTPGSPNWNMAADIYPSTFGYPARNNADNKVDAWDLAMLASRWDFSGKFHENTIRQPTFDLIAKEVQNCEDTILLLGYWQFQGSNWVRVGGHFVTVPGIDFANLAIAFSDPFVDNAEPLPHGGGGAGQVLPPGHIHPAGPAEALLHNDALYVSHDSHAVMIPSPSPGGPQLGIVYEPYNLTGTLSNMQGQNCPAEFKSQQGTYVPSLPVFTEVEYGVFVSPVPPMTWKPNYQDYAPSGMPDFDERQMLTYNWSNLNAWSHCAPTAAADFLWWFDSKFETNTIPPPTVIDNFPLVSTYATMPPTWDDHDLLNVQPLIEHLAYLMDTDGRRTLVPLLAHTGTSVTDMQTGLAQYLSWTGVNPQGDVNGDGIVDQTDLNIVGAAYNSVAGSSNWNMAADIWPATTGWPNRLAADNKVDLNDAMLVAANMNRTGMFHETTVPRPEFDFIEKQVEKCEGVALTIGFWTFSGGVWTRLDYPNYPYPSTGTNGHVVTVAGVNSTTSQIAISDPAFDAFENNLIPTGYVAVPHAHTQPEPPYTTHNNASLVSQDVYSVAPLPPIPPCPGGNWAIMGYPPAGALPVFAVIENAVVMSPVHDVAVTNVASFRGRTVLFQGFTANVTVTVANHGLLNETVNVSVYANMTATANTTKIGSFAGITLTGGQFTDLTCVWNASGFEKWNATNHHGNYTLFACVDPVLDETHLEDNNFTDGAMFVSMLADLNGGGPTIWVFIPDGKCNILDVSVVAKCFGSYPGCPPPLIWNTNCDVTGLTKGVPDDKVNILDVQLVASHFGNVDP